MARARKASGLTHAAVARRMGVDERTYRLMEAGIEPVRPSHAEAFRHATGMSDAGMEDPSSVPVRRSRPKDDGPAPDFGGGVDGITALAARRKELVSEIGRLKAELAQAKARLADVGVAIRGKRNELRAGKEAVKREATPQSLGGHARSLSMTPEERSDIASRAAKARWEKRRSAS